MRISPEVLESGKESTLEVFVRLSSFGGSFLYFIALRICAGVTTAKARSYASPYTSLLSFSHRAVRRLWLVAARTAARARYNFTELEEVLDVFATRYSLKRV